MMSKKGKAKKYRYKGEWFERKRGRPRNRMSNESCFLHGSNHEIYDSKLGR